MIELAKRHPNYNLTEEIIASIPRYPNTVSRLALLKDLGIGASTMNAALRSAPGVRRIGDHLSIAPDVCLDHSRRVHLYLVTVYGGRQS